MILRSETESAFSMFQVCPSDSVEHMLFEAKKHLKDKDGLVFDEFCEVIQSPSMLEQWAQSLPLWQLLAAAIPRKKGVVPLIY